MYVMYINNKMYFYLNLQTCMYMYYICVYIYLNCEIKNIYKPGKLQEIEKFHRRNAA